MNILVWLKLGKVLLWFWKARRLFTAAEVEAVLDALIHARRGERSALKKRRKVLAKKGASAVVAWAEGLGEDERAHLRGLELEDSTDLEE